MAENDSWEYALNLSREAAADTGPAVLGPGRGRGELVRGRCVADHRVGRLVDADHRSPPGSHPINVWLDS